MSKKHMRVQKNFNKNGISRVPHSVAPKLGPVTPCNCSHLALMAMEGRFAFPAIRSLLLTAEVTVLLQVMPKEVWYGLWLFS